MAIRLATAPQAAFNAVFTAAKDDALDAAFDLIDGGVAAGVIKVYTGSPPTSVNDAATGTLLATFTLTDPAFGASASAVKTLDADPDLTTTAANSGTPGYGRGETSAGAVIFDGTVTTSGGGGDFITSSSPWTAAQTVNLTSGTQSIV